jgi:exodeoxyribonuclease VII large subunit
VIIYSVSEITQKVRQQVSSIGWVWVKGEVSNLNYHSSGHIYFSLKDEESIIKAVIFRRTAPHIKYRLKEGQEFQIFGNIDIWRKGSQYQIIVEQVIPGKTGAFYLRFQEVKERLEKKGLFNEKYKKELPEFPKAIGIITSGEGAAIRDVLKIIRKRSPFTPLIVRPTLMQGEEAVNDIVSAIKEFNEYGKVELLILTRGGGSIEDLWVFNEEEVAYAIFKSDIPIISAIGHERDFSISDFIADRRAATPTEAGEIAVPSIEQLMVHLKHLYGKLKTLIDNKIESYRAKLETLRKSYAIRKPLSVLEFKQQTIDHLEDLLIQHGVNNIQSLRERIRRFTPKPPELSTLMLEINNLQGRLKNSVNQLLKDKKQIVRSLESTLQATSYEKTLSRGYSIVRKGTKIIRDSQKLEIGDNLHIQFHKGSSKARVEETEPETKKA